MDPPSSIETPATVVIGYGNPLRGDDAVGRKAAAVVESWQLPHVRVLSVQQLTPELAELLAVAEMAVFVDAGPATENEAVSVTRIWPAHSSSSLGHVSDPTGLLALAQVIYGRCPPAWCILVPATSFEFGAGLSSAAERGLATALQQIADMVTSIGAARPTPHAPHQRCPGTSHVVPAPERPRR